MTDDVLVVAYGRSCLCVMGTDLMYFGCDLIDKREHDREGDSVLTEDVLTHGIAVVDEVTAEDSCKMEITSVG